MYSSLSAPVVVLDSCCARTAWRMAPFIGR